MTFNPGRKALATNGSPPAKRPSRRSSTSSSTYLVKQPIRAFGPDESAKLRKSFAQSGDNVRELMVRIVADAAIRSGRANSEQASGK